MPTENDICGKSGCGKPATASGYIGNLKCHSCDEHAHELEGVLGEPVAEPPGKRPPGEYTRTWFTARNRATFVEYIHPAWAGKPCRYLELGVFEGMALAWMLQNVLTHPDARAVGVDPWLPLCTPDFQEDTMHNVWRRARNNTAEWRYQAKCELIRMTSTEYLRGVVKTDARFDIIMIDGGHYSYLVAGDAHLAIQCLKPCGWLLFDDVENVKPKQDHVKEGIDMFRAAHPEAKQLWKHKFMEAYTRD